MSEPAELTPTEQIQRLLTSVPVDTPRHRALRSALEFKGSWVRMAHRLRTVEEGELWVDWGHDSLRAYCKDELHLGRGEIRKLREGFEWLATEAPDLAEAAATSERSDGGHVPPIPDIDTIDQLARGFREVQDQRIPRRTYEDLKQAALDGKRSPHQLRRQFKEAIPEHLRDVDPPDPKKHFKKALKALEQALQELVELQKTQERPDNELTEKALRLRDEMSLLVASRED